MLSSPQKGPHFFPTNGCAVDIKTAALRASICGCAWQEGHSTLTLLRRKIQTTNRRKFGV
jgi:hypothetical protein